MPKYIYPLLVLFILALSCHKFNRSLRNIYVSAIPLGKNVIFTRGQVDSIVQEQNTMFQTLGIADCIASIAIVGTQVTGDCTIYTFQVRTSRLPIPTLPGRSPMVE